MKVLPCLMLACAFCGALASSAFASADDVEPTILIENYEDSDVLHYPLALVQGRTPGLARGVVVVENLSSNAESRIARAKVVGARFKALVELQPGRNDLIVSAGSSVCTLTLIYRASANRHFVRVVWFVGSDDDERSRADASDVVRKLRVATRLWQTATGERLFAAGYGRRSFRLESNENEEVVVWKLHGQKRASEYLAMPPDERFRSIYRETRESKLGDRRACYFIYVALGESEYDLLNDETRLALGTDEVAMLDSSRALSWPERLDQVEDLLLDESRVSQKYSRDSAYRMTKWALASSTLGAGLHELGHAFGLAHSSDPNDFMSRGFDKFNRIFTVYEPSSALGSALRFDDRDVASWGRESAVRLLRSKWIE